MRLWEATQTNNIITLRIAACGIAMQVIRLLYEYYKYWQHLRDDSTDQ